MNASRATHPAAPWWRRLYRWYGVRWIACWRAGGGLGRIAMVFQAVKGFLVMGAACIPIEMGLERGQIAWCVGGGGVLVLGFLVAAGAPLAYLWLTEWRNYRRVLPAVKNEASARAAAEDTAQALQGELPPPFPSVPRRRL